MPNDVVVEIYDVGQGDGILIFLPPNPVDPTSGPQSIMMDLGSSRFSSPKKVSGVRTQLLRYIRNKLPGGTAPDAVKRIDLMIISHSDVDHYSMISELVDSKKKSDPKVIVLECIFAGDRAGYTEKFMKLITTERKFFTTGATNMAPAVIEDPPAPWTTIVSFHPDVHLYRLSSSIANGIEIGNAVTPGGAKRRKGRKEKNSDVANTNSAVFLLEYKGHKILLSGDATIKTEVEILARTVSTSVRDLVNLKNNGALKVAHHGSNTSSGVLWLNAINPGYSIISAGLSDIYKHPNKDVTNRLIGLASTKDVADHSYVCCFKVLKGKHFLWENLHTPKAVYTTITRVTRSVPNKPPGSPVSRTSYRVTLPEDPAAPITIEPFTAEEKKADHGDKPS